MADKIKSNYILNFMPIPVIIRTGRGDYGPIESDGEVIYDQERTLLGKNDPRRLFVKRFFKGEGINLKSYSWHIEVKMGNRTVPFPSQRGNVLLLVGFDAACAIKMSGRTMADIIVPERARERNGVMYCEKFIVFR